MHSTIHSLLLRKSFTLFQIFLALLNVFHTMICRRCDALAMINKHQVCNSGLCKRIDGIAERHREHHYQSRFSNRQHSGTRDVSFEKTLDNALDMETLQIDIGLTTPDEHNGRSRGVDHGTGCPDLSSISHLTGNGMNANAHTLSSMVSNLVRTIPSIK